MSARGALIQALGAPTRRLLRAARLPAAERRFLLEAAVALLSVEVQTRLQPYSDWRWRVQGAEPRPGLPPAPGEGPPLPRLLSLFGALAGRAPWRPSCLVRTLTLRELLARRGLATTLRFGVGAGPRAPEAHCWLEQEGQPIYGHRPDRYRALEER